MRISPKISEKPADSRNKRPPRAMLFTAKVSQRLIGASPFACSEFYSRFFAGGTSRP